MPCPACTPLNNISVRPGHKTTPRLLAGLFERYFFQKKLWLDLVLAVVIKFRFVEFFIEIDIFKIILEFLIQIVEKF